MTTRRNFTITYGKRKLTGDHLFENPNELILVAGTLRYYIPRGKELLIVDDRSPRELKAKPFNPLAGVELPPQISGGIVEIKRRRAAAAASNPNVARNMELEETMSDPRFPLPETVEPVVE